MKNLLFALAITFLSCILFFLYLSITDSVIVGFYVSILSFPNIIIPTYLLVLLNYYVVNKIVTTQIPTMLTRALLLMTISIVALVLWAYVEVSLFYSNQFTQFDFLFMSEFAGYIPLVLITSSLVSILGHYFIKKS